MKYVFVAMSFLLAGYFLYPQINPGSTLSPQKKSRFENFINTEAKKFAEIQDADAKLKAAEEMYGKMMILLLAEMGLRSQHELKPALAGAKSDFESFQSNTPALDITSVEVPSVQPIIASDSIGKPDSKEKAKPQDEWVKYSTTPFLEKLKGKDRRLVGQFEGTLTHKNENEGRIDTVVMDFNLTQTDKGIAGSTLVFMVDPSGKEYSRNAGNGGNRALKGSDSPDAYFVEASPNSYFKINLKNFPQVTGQYYERGKLVGNVHLKKTH